MSFVHLITEILTLFVALFSIFFNFSIILIFFKKRVSSENFRFAFYLAIGDLGYAISAFIHVGYLVFNWSENNLNYSPHFIIFSNSFLPAHLKIIIIISLSMAIDRCFAIFSPVFYRKANRIRFANFSLFLSFLCFFFDFFFQILSADYLEHPNCATMACFVNQTFLNYLSFSNTIGGCLMVFMSFMVFFGLQKFERRKAMKTNRNSTEKGTIFSRKSNQITVGILFSSMIFVTIPSLLVTFYEKLFQISLFDILGPFYIFAILLNGNADGLIFLILNRYFLSNKNPINSSTISVTIPAKNNRS